MCLVILALISCSVRPLGRCSSSVGCGASVASASAPMVSCVARCNESRLCKSSVRPPCCQFACAALVTTSPPRPRGWTSPAPPPG